MKTRPYLILLLATTCIGLAASFSAQCSQVTDSLKAVTETAKHDTIVCYAYLRWGEQHYRSNPDTALILWQKVYDIAQKNLSTSLDGSIKTRFLDLLAEGINNIGYINGENGNIQKQTDYYHESLKIYEQIGNQIGMANSLNNIGYVYDNQGNIQGALECYQRSLNIYEEIQLPNGEIGDDFGIANSLNNIAYVFSHQEDYKNALKYYQMSLAKREEVGDKKGIAQSFNNIAYIYDIKEDPSCTGSDDECFQIRIQKALENYQKSLKIREEIGDQYGISVSFTNLARFYFNRGDPTCTLDKGECLQLSIEKALKYHDKSVAIQKKTGDKKGMAHSLNSIGKIYFEIGDISQAREYANKSMKLAQELKFPRHIREASLLLSKTLQIEGNYQEALEMYELHILMRDSIKNEENEKAIIRQQTKYEFEKAQLVKEQEEKEATRRVLEATSRRDNLQYSVIFIAILVLFGGVLMLGFIKMSERMAEGLIFFSFLIFFEFMLVLADPYIENWSGGAPGIKLLFNAGIAAFIFPLHAFFESKLKVRLAQK